MQQTLSRQKPRSTAACGLALAFCAITVCTALVALTPASLEAADHVIHISVDGLHPDHLRTKISAGQAPNFERFLDEGAWTVNARTDYSHTITLPNHTSMLTGRPVCSPSGPGCEPVGAQHNVHHGYQSNGEPLSTWTLHNQGNTNIPYIASTFDVAHDAGLSTALYASKSKFVIFEQSYNATNGANHPNGRDKIDAFFAQQDASAAMQTQVLAGLASNHFNYTFIHYADTDIAGHGYGWGSTNYMNAIATVDGYLGQLFNLIETDASFAGRTAIVLSTDHGGSGNDHSVASNPAHYTIPFFAWGAGVAHGDLYTYNAGTRTNPGAGRPAYNVSGQPIRNGDGGNLALSLLGLGAIPGSLINSTQNLLVAVPGDFNLDNVVDSADYVAWKKGVGTPGQYSLWQANFGAALGGGAGGGPASVPEPTALTLIVAAAFFAASRLSLS